MNDSKILGRLGVEPMGLSSQIWRVRTLLTATACKVHASQLWGFKLEEGLAHYAHALNQHTLLVVG